MSLALDVFGKPILLAEAPLVSPERIQAIKDEEKLQDAIKRDFNRAASRQSGLTLADEENKELREAKLDDLVDLLSPIKDGDVKLVPKRGYLKREIGYLTDDEIVYVVKRLRARSADEDLIQKGVLDRIPEDRRDGIITRLS